MESRARFLGHSIHQILIVFPLGLLTTSVVFDILWLTARNGVWETVAFYMIVSGILGGIAAAVYGIIDYMAIPSDTRAKGVGRLHGIGNVAVLLLFGGSWYLRFADPAAPTVAALALSFSGAAVACLAGWLGGELVNRMGVGVADDANLNASSSPLRLSKQVAKELAKKPEAAA